MILGTDGYIELPQGRRHRRSGPATDHLFLVDAAGTEYVDCSDVDLHYYPDLVHDVIHRTETACPQPHTFEVTRLAITAQQDAAERGYAE